MVVILTYAECLFVLGNLGLNSYLALSFNRVVGL